MIKNKRILITGIAGTIGSELSKQLSLNNHIYGVDLNETALSDLLVDNPRLHGRVGDIRDYSTMADIFSDFKPQIIFHAAARKCVNLMESIPLEALQVNIIGTYNLIHCAKRWECVEKFIFISTDKAVLSQSIMGATKRLGEIMIKNQGKGYMVVRFGNILGSNGSVIPIWQRQIKEGGPVTVTDIRATRYFMTIEQSVELVITAAQQGKGGEIFILDMGKPVKVIELAKQLIRESKKSIPIKFIGLRPGEVLHEKLMFAEEQRIAKKQKEFYVIKDNANPIF